MLLLNSCWNWNDRCCKGEGEVKGDYCSVVCRSRRCQSDRAATTTTGSEWWSNATAHTDTVLCEPIIDLFNSDRAVVSVLQTTGHTTGQDRVCHQDGRTIDDRRVLLVQVPYSTLGGLMATDEPTPSVMLEQSLHCTTNPSLSHRMQVIDRATHAVVVFSFSFW